MYCLLFVLLKNAVNHNFLYPNLIGIISLFYCSSRFSVGVQLVTLLHGDYKIGTMCIMRYLKVPCVKEVAFLGCQLKLGQTYTICTEEGL